MKYFDWGLGKGTQRAWVVGEKNVEMAVGNKEVVGPLFHSTVQEWQEVYSTGEDSNRWNQLGKGKFQSYNKGRK